MISLTPSEQGAGDQLYARIIRREPGMPEVYCIASFARDATPGDVVCEIASALARVQVAAREHPIEEGPVEAVVDDEQETKP